jgi:hypothetical protein
MPPPPGTGSATSAVRSPGDALSSVPTHTLAARGLEEHHVRITRIFVRIISFMVFKNN